MNSTPSSKSLSSVPSSGRPLATASGSGKPYVGMDLTQDAISGYRILHRIGVGGMAEVYLAFHETLQRHVAIKVLRSDLATSADHTSRFLQEARAAASLIHPNIVQVYDVGSSGVFQFIAQEYIPGITLRNLIQRRGVLSAGEGLSIMLQIASALSKAGSAGVVHRDIKPDNILLTSEGEVKVADFGLARARSQNSNLTEVGVALGTPLYMSPEQIQGKSVDARSDLYSLGVTAYEMFSGSPPFQGETPLALAIQHVQNPPPELSQLRPDLNSEIVAIVNKLLAKHVDDRFESASELVRTIRRVSESLAIPVSLEHPYPVSGIVAATPMSIGTHTTRLQTIALKDSKRNTQRTKSGIGTSWISALLWIAAVIVAGYTVAQLDRKPVIQPPKTLVTSVKKRSDIREQFFYAVSSNTPADWQAVEAYFPPEGSPLQRNYNVKAWLHLAWTAVAINNVSEAMLATQKILSTSNVEPVMRVSALVARSLALQKIGGKRESGNELTKARDLFASLNETDRKRVEGILPKAALSHWYSDTE